MLGFEKALRSLTSDVVHCVDEENLPFSISGLFRSADYNARLHRRVVEEVRPESEHAFE